MQRIGRWWWGERMRIDRLFVCFGIDESELARLRWRKEFGVAFTKTLQGTGDSCRRDQWIVLIGGRRAKRGGLRTRAAWRRSSLLELLLLLRQAEKQTRTLSPAVRYAPGGCARHARPPPPDRASWALQKPAAEAPLVSHPRQTPDRYHRERAVRGLECPHRISAAWPIPRLSACDRCCRAQIGAGGENNRGGSSAMIVAPAIRSAAIAAPIISVRLLRRRIGRGLALSSSCSGGTLPWSVLMSHLGRLRGVARWGVRRCE